MRSMKITIRTKTSLGWPVYLEETRADGRAICCTGYCNFNFPDLIASRLNPEVHGRELGRQLFLSPVADLAADAPIENLNSMLVQSIESGNERIHVQFQIEATDPEFGELRWECLCFEASDEWRFIGFDQLTPFSIYVPSSNRNKFPPFPSRELKVLIVAVCTLPEDDPNYFDAAEIANQTQEVLKPIPADILADNALKDSAPTLDAICAKLTTGQYQILNLICHGRQGNEEDDEGNTIEETWFYLRSSGGEPGPVTGKMFINRLITIAPSKLPYLIHFSACQSAVSARENDTVKDSPSPIPVRSVAQRLVGSHALGIPAVLAMIDTISVKTALALTGAFYSRLREHGEPDQALSEARAGLSERPDVHVPALFSRLNGQSMFSDRKFLDSHELAAAWNYWLSHLPKPIFVQFPSDETSVPSPLKDEWESFIDCECYQNSIQEKLDTISINKNKLCHTDQCMEAVEALLQVDLGQSCAMVKREIIAKLDISINYLNKDRQSKEWYSSESLDDLKRYIKARRYQSCFPVVGEYGSGRSFFLNTLVNNPVSDEDLLFYLPLQPQGSDPLDVQVLKKVCEVAGSVRKWECLNELSRDLHNLDAILVVLVDNLHEYIENVPVKSGWTRLAFENSVERLALPAIRCIFTIQDTSFDKVVSSERRDTARREVPTEQFWTIYGQDDGVSSARSIEAPSFLLGWVPLNDRNETEETGRQIIANRLRQLETAEDSHVENLWDSFTSTQRRLLSSPLPATCAVNLWREEQLQDERRIPSGYSINRLSLVYRLLNRLIGPQSELLTLVRECIESASKVFYQRHKNPSLKEITACWPEVDSSQQAFLIRALRDSGLIVPWKSSAPDDIHFEPHFDPIWYYYIACEFKKQVPKKSKHPLKDLLKKLKNVVHWEHREGVSEFSLALFLERYIQRADSYEKAGEVAAEFALGLDAANPAAFRSMCYEIAEIQRCFAASCNAKYFANPDMKLDGRTLFSLLLFVDAARELPFVESSKLVSPFYAGMREANHSAFCAAILERCIWRCPSRESVWEALSNFSGSEELTSFEQHGADYQSSFACQLAGLIIQKLKDQYRRDRRDRRIAKDAMPDFSVYLASQRTRARLDRQKINKEPQRPRPPYFFRTCMIYHFCDWYLAEYGISALNSLDEANWFYAPAITRFGENIAFEMKKEIVKSFGRWYRRNWKEEGLYTERVRMLIASGSADRVETAYFLIRHTVSNPNADYVSDAFKPLVESIGKFGRSSDTPELAKLRLTIDRNEIKFKPLRTT